MMTDRELLLAIGKMICALAERLTGERIAIEVETDNGSLIVVTSAGSPGPILVGASLPPVGETA